MSTSRRLLVLLLLFCLSAGVAHAEERDELLGEAYPLDALARRVEPTGPMRCPAVPLESYSGRTLRWKKDLKVHPAFAERLAAFEKVAAEVATRVYGRTPTRITHLGSYNCRRIRLYPDLLSEHGVGNAIDVTGFEFAALPRDERAKSPLPKALRVAFSARVLDHWDSPEDGKAAGYHRRFLRELAAELERRPDIFRVMLGPSYPGHKDHFHFDCAPYRLVVL
jgi:hypothetical protein